MGLDALRNRFKDSALGKLAIAGTVALPFALASLPAANDAHAGEPQTASAPQQEITNEQAIAITEKRRAMRKFSEDPKTKGIGVFINLQAGATPADGDQIGGILKNAFASKGVSLEYRTNHSLGTATDITFYVKGVPYKMTLGEIKGNLGTVLSHHQGAWLPETAALSPEISQR